jgi:hypothetical protein
MASPVLLNLADILRLVDFAHIPARELGVKAASMQQMVQALAKHINSMPKGSALDPAAGSLLACITGFVMVLNHSGQSWMQRVARVKGLKPFFRRWTAEVVDGGSLLDLQDLGNLLNMMMAMLDSGVLSISLEDVEAMHLAQLALKLPLELGPRQAWQASLHSLVAGVALRAQGSDSVQMARAYGPALVHQLQVSCCCWAAGLGCWAAGLGCWAAGLGCWAGLLGWAAGLGCWAGLLGCWAAGLLGL